jgi:hypothetical protein
MIPIRSALHASVGSRRTTIRVSNEANVRPTFAAGSLLPHLDEHLGTSMTPILAVFRQIHD